MTLKEKIVLFFFGVAVIAAVGFLLWSYFNK